MRIGTNHGSLSARILSYYGDTPRGMVESAFEFADICRDADYHNFLFSMKASNPLVMVQAYRLLAEEQYARGWDYPLHLGVTEACPRMTPTLCTHTFQFISLQCGRAPGWERARCACTMLTWVLPSRGVLTYACVSEAGHACCSCAPSLSLLLWHVQAGEGEDGRMKSAIGIGALLMDGLGDTIRVSLTEDPEKEIDPCRHAPAACSAVSSFPRPARQVALGSG